MFIYGTKRFAVAAPRGVEEDEGNSVSGSWKYRLGMLLVDDALFGLRGGTLTKGAFDPLGTRHASDMIESYLDTLIQPLVP